MDDFLNRITAQRMVINIVNRENRFSSPLVGLSSKSLERWKQENSVPHNSELLTLLYFISSKLFFLANKSQEQITNEYQLLSKNVSDLIEYLEQNIKYWNN